MPDLPAKTRRKALEALSRDALATLTAQLELAVEDRRSHDAHVDAIVRSRSVDFADVLRQLSRDELKAICEALGLDPTGKEKEPLVERILGKQTMQITPSKNGGTNGEELDLPPEGTKLTVEQLESHLWRAADILRGSIDSSDYKNFIFGLLFLKRLSDVFEEEAERLIADGTDPKVAWSDRDYHRFFVPKRARWSEVQKQATGIGDFLNKACSALEEENGSLEGVLKGIDYNDEHKLGNAKHRDDVLSRLVLHFSRLPLRNADLSEPDMLGRAYEYLIERFADDAGKKGGEFYTPRKVVQLIVELLEPKETDRICDPTCGSGGMLIDCAKFVERHGGDPRKLVLHGQEKNLGTWAICKMNMLLHSLPDARVEKGDTIRDPRLVKDGALEVYDKVFANPPFSLDDWGREVAEADSFGRFRFGMPPKTKGDLAFVQHMVATMNIHGRVGVVMPHGALSRGPAEGDIRASMVREDLFEAIIGLPSNLFYGTGIPAAILVLSKDKPKERRGKVMFIDASREFEEGKAQNYLRDEDIEKMARTFHAWNDVDQYARVASVEEVEKNRWDLTISNYVETHTQEERVGSEAAVSVLKTAEAARCEAENRMRVALQSLAPRESGASGQGTKVPESWLAIPFLEVVGRPSKSLCPAVQTLAYKPSGRFPVIDQGKAPVAGYIDDPALLYSGPLPVIVFGDHTREWKYVDFPFAVGADGTQLLLPNKDVDPKFLFYALSSLPVKSLGYARHFKLLKEMVVNLPPTKEEQRAIAAVLDAIRERKAAELRVAEAVEAVERAVGAVLLAGVASVARAGSR